MHTSRLGMASSEDGIHFTTEPTPVFYPDVDSQQDREWPGGVEDPRVVESEDGTYVLAYTQWNRRNTDIGIATSTDLIHWTKHGPALSGRKIPTPRLQIGQHRHPAYQRPPHRRQDSRQVLDVLGRGAGAAGNFARPDPLDTGRGFVRQSHRVAAQSAGTLRQRLSRSGAAFATHGSRDCPHLQRQECRGPRRTRNRRRRLL